MTGDYRPQDLKGGQADSGGCGPAGDFGQQAAQGTGVALGLAVYTVALKIAIPVFTGQLHADAVAEGVEVGEEE